MGGWIVYWIAEYHYIQYKVNHLCKTEGGVTVYVTPEDWRKMIGEEEWSQLTEFNYSQKQYYPTEKIVVNNVDYYPSSSINARLVKYSSHKKINEFIGQNNSLVIDLKSNTILMNYRYYSAGVGAWLAGGNPKFWLNEIYDCNDSISQEFSNLIRFYSKSQ